MAAQSLVGQRKTEHRGGLHHRRNREGRDSHFPVMSGNLTHGSSVLNPRAGYATRAPAPSPILTCRGRSRANSGEGYPMPDAEILSLVRDLRARAEEISTRAETFNDADARQRMRTIAATYEKLATTYEKLAQRLGRS